MLNLFKRPTTPEPVSGYVPRHGLDVESIPPVGGIDIGMHRTESTCSMSGVHYGECCRFSGVVHRFIAHADFAEWEADLIGIDLEAINGRFTEQHFVEGIKWVRDDSGHFVYRVSEFRFDEAVA